MERAVKRIVASSKQLLQDAANEAVLAEPVSEALKACRVGALTAERHGCGRVPKLHQCILPSKAALGVGAYAEAVRRLECVWKAQTDASVADAIGDALRAAEELGLILRAKGYPVQ